MATMPNRKLRTVQQPDDCLRNDYSLSSAFVRSGKFRRTAFASPALFETSLLPRVNPKKSRMAALKLSFDALAYVGFGQRDELAPIEHGDIVRWQR